jgi:cytochrome P450
MLTMLIAGHDTSTALRQTFYLLGKNPEIYSRLQTELDVPSGQLLSLLQVGSHPYWMRSLRRA